jgi:uncharacterized protein (TIGR03437 family)
MLLYVCLFALLLAPPQLAAQVRVSGYRIETVAGSQRNGDGGSAIAAQISKMQGIAVDRSGNLYLSDTDHHRVRKVTLGGVITTVAGTGEAGYFGDGGPAKQAQLNAPYGLAVDGAGNLYIADLGNNRIRRVWPDGVITTLIPNTTLATPRNLVLDSAGSLYVSEFDGHRIRRVAPDGSVTTVVGTGRSGFSGDGGPPEQAQLCFPAGLAIDRGGALLIADAGNNRVRRIFGNGTINTILGGSSGTALTTPVALATDLQGNIYVSDAYPVVRAFSVSGRWSDVAGGAVASYSGDGGAAIRAALTSVRDLAVDAASNIYLADGARLRKIDVLGIITTVAGDGFLHAIGDGGSAQDALLSRPSSVALDSAGTLTIADTGTQRVRQIASGVISTLVGDGTGSTTSLNSPMGVAADAAGTMYIADTGNGLVRAIGADRRLRTIMSAARTPRGVCLSRSGILYVVDTGNGRLLRVGSATDIIASQLNAPEACALDSFGNLYLAETGAHRVRRLSPAGDWTTVAGTGTAGSDGDEAPAVAAHLSFPRGLAVDDSGNLFISDTGGNRIRLVTPDGTIHSIAGTGFPGYSGDADDALQARLNGPAGLALDGAGAVYVADSLNDRVRRLLPYTVAPEQAGPVAVVNALSGIGGNIAPGELVQISGQGFGGDIPAEVWFGPRSVAVLTSVSGQLTVQAPEELSGANSVRLEVRVAGKVIGVADLGVADAAPGVLPLAINQDGSLNSGIWPAASGRTLVLFATGQGRLQAARPVLPVSVTIAGAPADVLTTQAAAGSTGLVLLTVRVPGGFVPAGQVPLVLTVGAAQAAPIGVWLQ